MTVRKVNAGQGWQWFVSAVGLIKNHPVPFLVMGLILGVISIIPGLGTLIMLILGPALMAGTCYAAQQADNGKAPEIGHLFRGFQGGDRVGSLIALCLPNVVAMVLIVILFIIFGIGAVAAMGSDAAAQIEANPAVLLPALGMSLLILIPLTIIIGFISSMLTYFAVPRTLLEGGAAIANMKDSLGACWKNFGAYFLSLLSLMVPIVILAVILGSILGMLGTPRIASLAINTLLYAVIGPMLFFAFKEVYGPANEAAVADDTPPPPPAV